MFYGLVHLLLLLAATSGLWMVRARALFVIGGLLLFPLPAALFNVFAAPVPAVVATLADPATSADCASETQAPPGAPADGDASAPGRPAGQACADAGGTPRSQVLPVVMLVNYLAVILGFMTAMLCRRRPVRRRS